MSEMNCAVYMMTNTHNTVLYVGVTSDLRKRLAEHHNKIYPNSFTAKYRLSKLVWFDVTSDIYEAIRKEKQIKNWRRKWKENLIHESNPAWRDLSLDFVE